MHRVKAKFSQSMQERKSKAEETGKGAKEGLQKISTLSLIGRRSGSRCPAHAFGVLSGEKKGMPVHPAHFQRPLSASGDQGLCLYRPCVAFQEPPVESMKKRTALAFIVCFILFFVFILVAATVRSAGFRLGFIPDAILCLILFAVWRAIRGTGSDSATLPNSPAPLLGTTESAFELLAKEMKQTFANSAAPSRPALTPLPSSANLSSPTPLLGTLEPAELSAFELLAIEKETGFRHEALWLKCFSEAEGDQARAEAAYTRERAATLAAQAIARLVAWRANIEKHATKIEGLLAQVPKEKAGTASNCQIGSRDWLESIPKALSEAIMDFQSAAEILQKELALAFSGVIMAPTTPSNSRSGEHTCRPVQR